MIQSGVCECVLFGPQFILLHSNKIFIKRNNKLFVCTHRFNTKHSKFDILQSNNLHLLQNYINFLSVKKRSSLMYFHF